jgi:glycosyltransferase involved in cell wall biosynthesis
VSDRRLRVSLVSEQLLQPVPGGIGTYVRALLATVPRYGAEVEPVVAWHRPNELAEAGVAQARRLAVPRQALYRRWAKGRKRPRVKGGTALVHAPSLAFPSRGDRPLVVTVHDVLFREYPEAYPRRGVEFHQRSLARVWTADLVICPSEATADAVRSLPDPPKRVRVIPMGTDFRPPSDADRDRVLERLQVERPYVLWCGTVEPRKNPEGVVRGFVRAVESGVPLAKEINLYLVGPPGWWRGDLAGYLESTGMTDRVRRLGDQPKAVREALLAGAEAFLFPSLAEGFGLPVLDAMACGAPVVTSNRSSLPEVAGAAALLCDPDDEDSIGQALSKILRDRDLAADLRRLGFKRAAEFGWDRTARETVACYREVLRT